ncbi:MAG TPA: alpha/beta fold hydrolase [Stellaceae bacterium]|nr:alpha/beta fold hydrolase [Stellaceae bacterium]
MARCLETMDEKTLSHVVTHMDALHDHVLDGVSLSRRLPEFLERAPWVGGDLQSVRNFLRRPMIDLEPHENQRIVLPLDERSGDRASAVLHRPRVATAGPRPAVILIHGLTGCEDSIYMRASTAHLLEAGFPVLRLNLRGAGPTRPDCRQHYHAGRTEDLRLMLAELPPDVIEYGVVAVGFSLGGNLLLKYLGETGSRTTLLAAATVSAPLDLTVTARHLGTRRNALYHWYFLKECQRETLAPASAVTAEERCAVLSAESLWQFDDRFTAPRNGFGGAADYYKRNSSQNFLDEVAVPTLLIHAQDDPIVPAEPYREYDWRRNARLQLALQSKGGHVGFHDRRGGTWHDRAIHTFFERVLSLA